MAIITQGIMGGISGTVGTVVGSHWRGIDYIRKRPTIRRSRSCTSAQRDQQLKLALVSRFTSRLKKLLNITYQQFAVRQTGCNSATAWLLQHAIAGSSPGFELDYPQVLISRGGLLGAKEGIAVVDTGHYVTFSWTNNAGAGGAKDNDKAIVVVYCPEEQDSQYAITTATRSSGTVTLKVTGFAGCTVHTWLGFISESHQRVANSVYTGTLVVL